MSYLVLDHERRGRYIDSAVSALKTLDFDTLVCTGLSGMLVGPEVARRLRKNLVIIRADTVGVHGTMIEHLWEKDPDKYVLLDDFTETGGTVKRVVAKMSEFWSINAGKISPKFVAAYFYKQDDLSGWNKFISAYPQVLAFRGKRF